MLSCSQKLARMAVLAMLVVAVNCITEVAWAADPLASLAAPINDSVQPKADQLPPASAIAPDELGELKARLQRLEQRNEELMRKQQSSSAVYVQDMELATFPRYAQFQSHPFSDNSGGKFTANWL